MSNASAWPHSSWLARRNVAAVAGRAAEVDVEEREALVDEQLLERDERPVGLPRRAAVRDRRSPGPGARRARPVALGGPPERALDSEPVAGGEREPLAGAGAAGRPAAAPSTAGIDVVTWRGREPAGRDARHRQQPQVLRPRSSLSPTAATHAPSGGPADGPPDARPGLTTWPSAAATSGGRFFGGRPRPRLGGVTDSIGATTEVDEAVVDVDVDEPRSVRRGQRREPQRPDGRRAPAARSSGPRARGRRPRGGSPGTSRRRRSRRAGRRPRAARGPAAHSIPPPATLARPARDVDEVDRAGDRGPAPGRP